MPSNAKSRRCRATQRADPPAGSLRFAVSGRRDPVVVSDTMVGSRCLFAGRRPDLRGPKRTRPDMLPAGAAATAGRRALNPADRSPRSSSTTPFASSLPVLGPPLGRALTDHSPPSGAIRQGPPAGTSRDAPADTSRVRASPLPTRAVRLQQPAGSASVTWTPGVAVAHRRPSTRSSASASARARKARPLCEIACFSDPDSSANVRPSPSSGTNTGS